MPASLRLILHVALFSERHQPEMRQRPDRDRKHENGRQTIPRPQQHLGLDRENGDHEIIAESGVAEEGTPTRIFAPEPADQGDDADAKDEERDQHIDREQRVEVDLFDPILISPMRRRPDETEAGLNGGSEGSFRGSDLIGQPAKIKRNDAPDELRGLKRRLNQLNKS